MNTQTKILTKNEKLTEILNLQNFIYDIRPHKIKTITINPSKRYISDYGFNLIVELISNSINYSTFTINDVLESFDFNPQNKKNGKVTKRLSKTIKETLNKTLPPDTLSLIGNVINLHPSNESDETYNYDFDFDIKWNDGDFGDSGSCFWSYNAGAKSMIKESGGFAIRIYSNYGDGVGRAFVLPYKNALILFNGYTSTRHNDTFLMAKILHKILNEYYAQDTILMNRPNTLSNFGSETGTLYLNNRGFVFHHKNESMEHYHDIDFEIDEICESQYHCDDCNEFLGNDEDFEGMFNDNGDVYCYSCYSQYYSYCESCGDDYSCDDGHHVDGQFYCDDCLMDNFSICESCEDIIPHDESIRINDEIFCKNCAGDFESETFCKNCESHDDDGLTLYKDSNGHYLCNDCLKSYVPKGQLILL